MGTFEENSQQRQAVTGFARHLFCLWKSQFRMKMHKLEEQSPNIRKSIKTTISSHSFQDGLSESSTTKGREKMPPHYPFQSIQLVDFPVIVQQSFCACTPPCVFAIPSRSRRFANMSRPSSRSRNSRSKSVVDVDFTEQVL